ELAVGQVPRRAEDDQDARLGLVCGHRVGIVPRSGPSVRAAPGVRPRKTVMDALHRIIDANANRAREALRLMEDCARFALGDAALTEALKGLRHDLRSALDAAGLDRGLLLVSRDTP